jgi:hypothetical protein
MIQNDSRWFKIIWDDLRQLKRMKENEREWKRIDNDLMRFQTIWNGLMKVKIALWSVFFRLNILGGIMRIMIDCSLSKSCLCIKTRIDHKWKERCGASLIYLLFSQYWSINQWKDDRFHQFLQNHKFLINANFAINLVMKCETQWLGEQSMTANDRQKTSRKPG